MPGTVTWRGWRKRRLKETSGDCGRWRRRAKVKRVILMDREVSRPLRRALWAASLTLQPAQRAGRGREGPRLHAGALHLFAARAFVFSLSLPYLPPRLAAHVPVQAAEGFQGGRLGGRGGLGGHWMGERESVRAALLTLRF